MASGIRAIALGLAALTSAATTSYSITNQNQLNSAFSSVAKLPATAMPSAVVQVMSAVKPGTPPTDTAAAATAISSAYKAQPSSFYALGAQFIMEGLTNGQDLAAIAQSFGTCNSANNTNPINPNPPIYPKKSSNDAPYDVSEQDLRSAIYIPANFTYGKVPPVLFLPGTAVEACENFANNIGKLIEGSNYGDPVYVNIPGNLLGDLQTSAEYAAYAINYISSITNSNVSTVSWSAGSITGQWATKYWPSTRNVTKDRINVSADYHGTELAVLICPPGFPCPPSVLQQFYNSTFIQTLRNNGGSSAYSDTTSAWTIFDEIVEPQQNPDASAFINNTRPGVSVTDTQLQDVCPVTTPAGAPSFGHEAMLYNPVMFALTKDALTNPGSANVARSGASSMCGEFLAPGLTVADQFATEALIPLGGYNMATYPYKVTTEPPIKAYAQKDMP